MIFLVCMTSLVLAHVFTKSLVRLVTGVHQVAAGDLDVEVNVRSKDEFGDLSAAFNDMSRNLQRLAASMPQVLPGTAPTVIVDGPKTYRTSVRVASPADAGAVTATMQRWAWYAARREGLHLDEATDGFGDPDLVGTAVRSVAPTLHLSSTDIDALVTEARIERYGAGETMQTAESVPDSMRLILAGRATLTVELKNGNVFTVGTLSQGDYIGQTALARERVAAGVLAIDEVTVLRVPVASLDRLVHRKPELARDIGKAIDQQRLRATPELLADVAL